MTNEEKKKAFGMLVDGATYQEVADELGVSKQCVHHEFGSYFNGRVILKKNGCKYMNIMSFLAKNNMSKEEFVKLAGFTYQTFCRILNGKVDPKKKSIDKILETTGMTYEEAFREIEE